MEASEEEEDFAVALEEEEEIEEATEVVLEATIEVVEVEEVEEVWKLKETRMVIPLEEKDQDKERYV